MFTFPITNAQDCNGGVSTDIAWNFEIEFTLPHEMTDI